MAPSGPRRRVSYPVSDSMSCIRRAKQQAAALQAQLEHLETQVGLLTKQYAIIAADYKALAAL